jgi:glycosyltransferase involved in cell wall biosynthesis
MKILFFAHDLVVCGTTVNAIELAVALRDFHGHDVVLFATAGPMVKLAEEKGLRFLPAPAATFHPSPARMRALREVVERERPDLIHIWEWHQCLDAYHVEHVLLGIPMVMTDMSMTLQRLLPKTLPTTFGTPELLDQAVRAGHRHPELLVPPVDVHHNAPNAVNPQPFREFYGLSDSDMTLVTVSRLDAVMKAESLVRTVDVVRRLGRDLPLRFVIVGDGDRRAELERMAVETNVELGRTAVVLTGALLDPRPAYAAADIVVGMGSSALRGMAFSKPVVIVGEQGFAAPFAPETAEFFYNKGIHGRGDGSPSNARLITAIRGLVEHANQRRVLGDFSREFVVRHFSLEAAAARLSEFCRDAVTKASFIKAKPREVLRLGIG